MISKPLSVLILTDGKMGDLAQCRGVARALTGRQDITEEIVRPNWLTSLPLPSMPLSALDRLNSMFATAPDIVIASGRRTVPYLRYFKSIKSSPPFTVFLKDPRFNRRDIDFIWAPTHDDVSGANIFSTMSGPHIWNRDALEAARTLGAERFGNHEEATIGLLLGGDSGSVKWTQTAADSFATCLLAMPENARILATASRRTPKILIKAITNALADRNFWLWDEEGPNPYGEILALSDRLVVTGDSHNMVSEALAPGVPVQVFQPPALSQKLVSCLDDLRRAGLIFNLDDDVSHVVSKPHDETGNIAEQIRRRFKSNAGKSAGPS